MLGKLTLKKKLVGTALLAALPLAVLATLDVHSVNQGVEALADVYENRVVPVSAIELIDRDFREVRFRMAGVLLDQMPTVGSSNHLKEVTVQVPEQWASFKERTSRDPMSPETTELVRNIDEQIPGFLSFSEKLSKAYASEDKKLVSSLLEDDWPAVQSKLVKPLEQLIPQEQEAVKQTYEKARRSGTRLFLVGLGVSGFSVAVLGGLGFGALRSILDPLRQTVQVLGAVAEGDLTQRLQIDSQDEIGTMAKSLNQAVDAMRSALLAIERCAEQVAAASGELSSTSQQMSSHAEETSAQANLILAAATLVNKKLQTVATGSEEMSATIKEIAKQSHESARVATEAVKVADASNQAISKLGNSSIEIGNVNKVITSVAQQTNLLALNATIEAARAGDAGKGFAVVANEVKALAQQTAGATTDISRRIEAIQADTKGAAGAIDQISQVIRQVNDISNTIAAAVEEQQATTNEMSRNVTEAACGTEEITNNMSGVAEALQGTTHGANNTLKAAHALAEMSTQLRDLVERFKIGNGNAPQGLDDHVQV